MSLACNSGQDGEQEPTTDRTAPADTSTGALTIWANQIENARQQTETAITQLTQLFGNIVTKLDQSIAASQRDGETNASTSAADGEQAQRYLSQVIADLREAQQSREILNKEIAAIVSHTADLSQMAEEVRVIAFQTNILSVNAAIEAAHAGASGSGFAVVAAEVRTLSLASRNTGQNINTRITAINEALHNIARRTASVSGNDNEIIQRAENNIKAVLDTQHERVSQFMSAAQATQQQNTQIKSNIEDALIHLQFQDRVSQILAQLSGAMLAADALAGDLAAHNLSDMTANYTTDEQRRIHAGLEVNTVAPQEVTFF